MTAASQLVAAFGALTAVWKISGLSSTPMPVPHFKRS
jgi:hypothetical protein